ncbi:MAG: hypothetical protein WDW38_005523 [Sanguina aurantia]
MRETRALPKGSSSRGELRDEVKRGFLNTSLAPQDATAIKFALSEGKLRLKQLKDMMGLMQTLSLAPLGQAASPPPQPSLSGTTAKAGAAPHCHPWFRRVATHAINLLILQQQQQHQHHLHAGQPTRLAASVCPVTRPRTARHDRLAPPPPPCQHAHTSSSRPSASGAPSDKGPAGRPHLGAADSRLTLQPRSSEACSMCSAPDAAASCTRRRLIPAHHSDASLSSPPRQVVLTRVQRSLSREVSRQEVFLGCSTAPGGPTLRESPTKCHVQAGMWGNTQVQQQQLLQSSRV